MESFKNITYLTTSLLQRLLGSTVPVTSVCQASKAHSMGVTSQYSALPQKTLTQVTLGPGSSSLNLA